jgi:UDP-N-acetylglucosamine 4,6-dehydratase
MQGGEVFVPKIPSMRVVDLARAIAPGSRIERIGIRAGEKMHEVLVSEDEARHTLELDDLFVVQPPDELWFGHAWEEKGRPLTEGFRYASDTNPQWLTVQEIQEMVRPIEAEASEQGAG